MRRVEGQRATRAHALMHTHAPPHACAPTQQWPECGALAHLGAPRRLLAGPVLREQAQQPCITVLVWPDYSEGKSTSIIRRALGHWCLGQKE